MSETPNKVIVNCTTGETSVVPLTEEEILQREVDSALMSQQQADREADLAAKAAAKASAEAKLAALGLTPEEIAALR
jgi:hypothetical protein